MNTIILFLLSIIIVTALIGRLSFMEWKKKNTDGTFNEYINGSNMTRKGVMVGMTSGLIFGFIDNFGLFTGMEILDPILKLLPGAGDPNVFAGYGNTFSDMVGAFLGTFGGRYVADRFNEDEYPMWSEAVGVFIGCLVGILAGKLVQSATKKSS